MPTICSHLLMVQGRPARVWRGGTGKALVLLHGEMGDASAHWRWCWSTLAERFSVFAPDLPGCGGMTAPLPEPSLAGFVDWTLALLDTLQLKQVALAGNSFGALVARVLAASQPTRIARLVMVNGGALNALPESGRGGLAGLSLLSGARAFVTPQTLDRALADKDNAAPEFLAEAEAGLAAFGSFSNDLTRAGRPHAAVPVCPSIVIWGTEDRLAPLKIAQALQKELPKAALKAIENAGRMPQMEQPLAFLAAVGEFMH